MDWILADLELHLAPDLGPFAPPHLVINVRSPELAPFALRRGAGSSSRRPMTVGLEDSPFKTAWNHGMPAPACYWTV